MPLILALGRRRQVDLWVQCQTERVLRSDKVLRYSPGWPQAHCGPSRHAPSHGAYIRVELSPSLKDIALRIDVWFEGFRDVLLLSFDSHSLCQVFVCFCCCFYGVCNFPYICFIWELLNSWIRIWIWNFKTWSSLKIHFGPRNDGSAVYVALKETWVQFPALHNGSREIPCHIQTPASPRHSLSAQAHIHRGSYSHT